jgi:hypothetical protein
MFLKCAHGFIGKFACSSCESALFQQAAKRALQPTTATLGSRRRAIPSFGRGASFAGRPGFRSRWRGGGFVSTPTNSKRRPEQRQPRVVNMSTVGIQETSCQLESGWEWAVRSAVEDARVTRT